MLSLIIPLYNEEDNVAPLQDELAVALKGHEYELILVDDCSTDKTLERIRRGPGVRVIEFEKNTGQSAAMYAGIMAARGDLAISTHHPTSAPREILCPAHRRICPGIYSSTRR